MKRLPDWQRSRIESAKRMRLMPLCEWTPGCKGRALGYLMRDRKLLWACPACADKERRHG